MESTDRQNAIVLIRAKDQLDPNGSVVQSGMNLADAVLRSLGSARSVEVTLEELQGASSSYFNVFLRRIQENCGLDAFTAHVKLQFASDVQRRVFERSWDTLRRGPRDSGPNGPVDTTPPSGRGFVRRLAARLRFWQQAR
jgi:hypothetical protein